MIFVYVEYKNKTLKQAHRYREQRGSCQRCVPEVGEMGKEGQKVKRKKNTVHY